MEDLKELIIDEDKEHALTKITHQKQGIKKVTSDHNVLLSKFNLFVEESDTKERHEVFNFRSKSNQEKFKEVTSSSTWLSEVFDTEEDINTQTTKFLKRLDKTMHKCFKKVRLCEKKPSEYEKLYGKWVKVRHLEDNESKRESKALEEELADKYADNIFDKIKEEISGMTNDEGAINSGKLWKLKKKLHKNYKDPPTAMKDSKGNLITEKGKILDETVKYYTKVLENREIKKGLEKHKEDRELLAERRLEQSKKNKTPDWDMDDITLALKSLKNNKSPDAFGYINELFKPGVIGSDLKLAFLRLMNQIKKQQVYPSCMEACNVTSIFKNKGSKSEFNKYRGIFRVLIFRSILEKLIYMMNITTLMII